MKGLKMKPLKNFLISSIFILILVFLTIYLTIPSTIYSDENKINSVNYGCFGVWENSSGYKTFKLRSNGDWSFREDKFGRKTNGSYKKGKDGIYTLRSQGSVVGSFDCESGFLELWWGDENIGGQLMQTQEY